MYKIYLKNFTKTIDFSIILDIIKPYQTERRNINMMDLIVLAMVIIQGLSLFFTFYTLVNIDKKNREIKRLRNQVKMYENYAYGLEKELVVLDNTKAELASKLSVTEYMLAEQAEMMAEQKTKKSKKG